MKSKIQRYISDELTHLVGRGQSTDDQYSTLIKILRSGWLTHPPHNPLVEGNIQVNPQAKLSENEMYIPQVVCFCDIPTEDLGIHMQKYSPFGLTFSKDFIVEAGGSPVFYVAREASVKSSRSLTPEFIELWEKAKTVDEMKTAFAVQTKGTYFDLIIKDYHKLYSVIGPLDPNWEFFRFLDFQVFSHLVFFDHRLPEDHTENYYFEREWRIVGNLRFSLKDVKRLIIPEKFSKKFRADCPNYYGQISFSPA